MKHPIVFGCLTGALASAMLTTSIFGRWPDARQMLLGDIGVLPFSVAVFTVLFLAMNANTSRQALKRTEEALEQSRKAEVATRYQKGMEMLASGEMSTRIGGLYLLRDVVVAAPTSYWHSVVDSLTPFIIERCASNYERYWHLSSQEEVMPLDDEAGLVRTPRDVVIALHVLGRGYADLKAATEGVASPIVRLDNTALCQAELAGLDCRTWKFGGSILQYVTFRGCNLDGVSFEARASYVTFQECSSVNADFDLLRTAILPADTTMNECDLSFSQLDAAPHVKVRVSSCRIDSAALPWPCSVGQCWYLDEAPLMDTAAGHHYFDANGLTETRRTVLGMPVYVIGT